MPLELIVGAAVGAAAASPTVRKGLRKGLVYGLAGAMVAYDNMAALAAKARQLRKGGTETAPSDTAAAAAAQPAHSAASTPEQPAPASTS
jgi:hypothetical protein